MKEERKKKERRKKEESRNQNSPNSFGELKTLYYYSLFTAVQYSAIYVYKGDWGTDKCKLHINTGEHTTMITLQTILQYI